jgi:hypothetical protein
MRPYEIALLACLLAGCSPAAPAATRVALPTYDVSLPFPIPASCPQNPYADPSHLTALMLSTAQYWIGTSALAAGHPDGAAWHEGANRVPWASSAARPAVEVNALGFRAPAASSVNQSDTPPLYPSTITFPGSGCWEIVATTTAQTLRFVVYAYPAR